MIVGACIYVTRFQTNQTHILIAGLIHYRFPLYLSLELVSLVSAANSKKALNNGLTPFNGHGFVGMVCSKLGNLKELASCVLLHLGVI